MLFDEIGKITAGVGFLTFLMWGFSFTTVQLGESTKTVALQKLSPVEEDTTDPAPIEARPCNSYSWFQPNKGNWESEGYVGGIGGSSLSSLHEMTCKWAAYQRGLSLDSTRLPKYVRPIGDSLRLPGGVLTYSVEMVQLKDYPSVDRHTLYFVAEVGDSLYYDEITKAAPHSSNPSSFSLRSLRPLNMPGAESHYIWFEYAESGRDTQGEKVETVNRWSASVFTYDSKRGMRHLTGVPIRIEMKKDGRLHGVRQLDVRIPEAGLMEVTERLQRGANITKGMGWHRVLGKHIIDSTAYSW